MALWNRDKDNKKAARKAIREGRQEARQAGRQARDEVLVEGGTRLQGRAAKRIAKRESKADSKDEMKLMEQLRQKYPGNIIRKTPGGEHGEFDIDARPSVPLRKMPRTGPAPEELGVTQEEADIKNRPGVSGGWRDRRGFPYVDPVTDMTPEQIAEMEAEGRRTDREEQSLRHPRDRRLEEKRRK